MVSLFGILNIGARGVSAAQAGLNVTGQNITNANTEGYSRQRLIQNASDPIRLPNGNFGQGVEIISVERLRDMFLENQIRGAGSETSYYRKKESIMTRIESIISDPLDPLSGSLDSRSSMGINNLLSKFFQSLHDLSMTPEAPETRMAVVESARTLAQGLNMASDDLAVMRDDMNQQVRRYVDEINRLSEEIASLNQRIAISDGGGKSANDLKDQRDRQLKRLAEIVPITTEAGNNGMIHVNIAAQRIVDGVHATALQVEIAQTSGELQINSIRIGRQGLDVQDEKLRLGELGAVIEARDNLLPLLQKQLDEFARSVIFEVNKIHSAASGLEGYRQLASHFNIPNGALNPDAKQTLGTIFNNPRLPLEAALEERPYPIQDGTFSIRVADQDNETRNVFDVAVKTSDTLYDIVERINRSDGVVGQARSALTFDPVFVQRARARKGIEEGEIGETLGNLAVAAATPIAETPGIYQFELHVRDASGGRVDADPTTQEIEPFVVNFNDGMTLAELANAINQSAGGRVRANVVPSDQNPDIRVLQIETLNSRETFSIQNDTSGLMQAFDFPITDPSIPLIGGLADRAVGTFSGHMADSFLGAGVPAFSPAFPGPPPSVIREGILELVVIDNNNTPTITQINIQAGPLDSMQELAAAIEAADPNLSVNITTDRRFIITASDQRRFFFQNDETGLTKAMGLDHLHGGGDLFGQPFTSGSFEIVVANASGTVTHIVEVPIEADAATVNGVPSLNAIIDAINRASGDAGAPIRASIVRDPRDPSRAQFQVEALGNYEFTFRSDDSLILSALGFQSGPVLDPTGDPPIEGAHFPTALGDNIGGLVRARVVDGERIEISAGGNDRITFLGDDSHFLAAAGFNTLFQGSSARTMRVNQDILNNVNLLAASSTGASGNNEAAAALAELEDRKVMQNRTLGEFYRTMVSGLGNEGARARQFAASNDAILRELLDLQEQESGVSLDEESINIIRYQQAFQASARIISTIDQLLDLVINRIGS